MGAIKPCLSYGRKFALASNILFGVLSLAMSIAGFVLRFGDQSVNQATLQKIKDSARDAFGVYDLSTNNFRPITENLKQAFGSFLIVIGIVSAPLVLFGFYTFLRKKRNFLFAYVIITGFLVAIQLFVNFYFFKSPEKVQQMIRPYLLEKINEYTGMHSADQVSLGWNYVMQEYQCCGVDSSADFNSSSYYASYCSYYGEYIAVPGCCRTLPSSYSQSWCYWGYDPMRKYCGGNSYDTYMWKDGCLAALLRFYYTRHTEVIWAMIGVGLIDQIVLFVFAIILLRKTKCKVEPARNSTTEVWITGGTQTTQVGLPYTKSPAPVPLQQQQGVSSRALIQHGFPSGQVPSASKSTAAAAPPPSQTAMQLIAPTFLPGAVMLVPTSHDYDRNTMQSTYIPMTTLPNISMQALPQTQALPDAPQRNYAPLTMW